MTRDNPFPSYGTDSTSRGSASHPPDGVKEAVLFLVGIGSSFKLHGVRYALITLGSVLLVVSVVLILRQPGLPVS